MTTRANYAHLNARIESIFRLTLRDFGRVHKLFHYAIYTMKCNRFRVDYEIDISERFIVSASRFNNCKRKFIVASFVNSIIELKLDEN